MQKIVTVTFHEENQTLTVDPPTPIELEQGDWVQWTFQNAPSGSLPIIEFETPLGPFQCLQSAPDGTVQGKGNIGEENGEGTLFPYRAFLLDKGTNGNGVVAISETSSVRNLPQPFNTSPVTVVTIVEGSNNELEIDVQPNPLTLFPGDTALWHVFGLPPGHFISFLFSPASEDATMDPLVGPFESMVVNRKVGEEEANVMRVIGVHFKPARSQHEYIYQIAVRDSSGQIRKSHEPVIDNLGDPPIGTF